MYKLVGEKDPGRLCDSFADYLADKCKRFDNLLDFCAGDTLVPIYWQEISK